MTNTQIEYFETVCETLSFSKAAAILYVSQPAISKSISYLEKEIGYELFERENSVLSLTKAGELFREFVRRYKAEFQLFQDKAEMLKAKSSQAIRVGCPETWNPIHFQSWFEEIFSRIYPERKFSLEGYKLSDLLLRLKNDKLDFVLSHDFYAPPAAGLHADTIAETGLGVLYAKHAFSEPVHFKELADKGFLVFDDEIKKRFSALIQSYCKAEGYETKTRNGGTVSKCMFELSRGNGVMLFTDWDNFVTNQAFGYYPVKGTSPVRIIYFADRVGKAGKAFVRELKKGMPGK